MSLVVKKNFMLKTVKIIGNIVFVFRYLTEKKSGSSG